MSMPVGNRTCLWCVCVCVCVCARARVRACLHACVRTSVCMRVCVNHYFVTYYVDNREIKNKQHTFVNETRTRLTSADSVH